MSTAFSHEALKVTKTVAVCLSLTVTGQLSFSLLLLLIISEVLIECDEPEHE
jgi:hypothetical protein